MANYVWVNMLVWQWLFKVSAAEEHFFICWKGRWRAILNISALLHEIGYLTVGFCFLSSVFDICKLPLK